MPAIVFKALNPDQIQESLAAREADEAAFQQRAREYETKLGIGDLTGIRGYDGSFSLIGIAVTSALQELPVGWRRSTGSMTAVPAKRTPEGRAVAAELKAMGLNRRNHPGVPDILHTPTNPETGTGFMIFPDVEQIGDDVFLALSKLPNARGLAEVDGTHWERAKLSEYHAAREEAGLSD